MGESRRPQIEAVTLFDRDGDKLLRTGRHEPKMFVSDDGLKEETTEIVEFDPPIPLGEVPDLAKHSDRVNEWMQEDTDE